MSKDKRLGRGLAALLGAQDEVEAPSQPAEEERGPEVISFASTPAPSAPPPAPPQHVEIRPAQAAAPVVEPPPIEPPVQSPVQPTPPMQPVGAQTPPPRPEIESPPEIEPPPVQEHAAEPTAREIAEGNDTTAKLVHLSVHEIDDNPFQPRRDFSEPEIASLSESLKEHDMLQPVLVRRINDRFQLISGERRLRAAIQAGWEKVPAQIREASDRLVAELAIVENLQRKDLNPVEKALSFRRYLDEHDCKQEDLAQRLKIDRSTIANLMRLLELPDELLQSLRTGSLSAGHARALLPLGDEPLQIDFCRRIRREGWSVRETERMVTEKIREEDGEASGGDKKKRRRAQKNQQIAALEQELRVALGTKVDIKQASRRRGQIVIHFTSHDEFERIRQYLTDDDGDMREAS